MGTTAKVFIVLNLVVALFFAVCTITLFGKQTYWVDQTRLSIDEANDIYRKKTQEIHELQKKLEDQTAVAEQKIKQLEEEEGKVINLEKENKALADTNRQNASTIKTVQDMVAKVEDMATKRAERNAELQTRLDEEVRKNTASIKEKEWHQQRAIEAASELREAENEMMQLAKSNAELVRRITLLSTQLEKYVRMYGADPEASVNPSGVAVSGKVLQVEPKLDLVILSVGSKDKVQKGMEFVISRGENYIGKVRVANVYDDMCSARILQGMTRKGENIKVSDAASILD